ncbi:MAG: histidine kinase [Pseudazoarcus pumilus]|nr:histidine kinase [Pseudazoarcus pumilus]
MPTLIAPRPICRLLDFGCMVFALTSLALVLGHFTLTDEPYASPMLILASGTLLLLGLLLSLRSHQRTQELRHVQRTFERAQAVAHVGSWKLQDGQLACSTESCHILGLPEGRPISFAQLLACTHPEDRARVSAALRSVLAGRAVDLQHRILVKGEVRWVHARAEPPGEVGMIGTVQDVTARREAEEALCHSRQRLRALGAYHERRVEEERAHIAREIHDELGQYLTTLRMDAAMLELGLAEVQPRAAQRLASMKALIDDAIGSVRRVACTLRPTALDLGLESGIEWLVVDFRERTHLTCSLEISDAVLPATDDARATLVFRILQEALTNIARHAEARSVAVRLGHTEGRLQLTVHDDGRGFRQDTVRDPKSFGLLGMHERAIAFGGSLRIDSAPGHGTTVQLDVPLENAPMHRDAFPETCAGCPLLEAAVDRPEIQT